MKRDANTKDLRQTYMIIAESADDCLFLKDHKIFFMICLNLNLFTFAEKIWRSRLSFPLCLQKTVMNDHLHKEERVCLNCGTPITGRVDKRFCSIRCKNEWNNSMSGPEKRRRNSVFNILIKNYHVLEMAMESGERAPELTVLAAAGFREEYVTGFRRIRRGRDEYRCFDICYNKTEARLYNIRRAPEMA